MPIYEYRCEKCKNEFEKLIFAGEDKDISCPDCKSGDVSKKNECNQFHGRQQPWIVFNRCAGRWFFMSRLNLLFQFERKKIEFSNLQL